MEFLSDSIQPYEAFDGWHATVTVNAGTDLSAVAGITLPNPLDAAVATGPVGASAAGQHRRGWCHGRLVIWARGDNPFTVEIWGAYRQASAMRHEENIASAAVGANEFVRVERAIFSPWIFVDVLAGVANVDLEIFIRVASQNRGL